MLSVSANGGIVHLAQTATSATTGFLKEVDKATRTRLKPRFVSAVGFVQQLP
jgi:hypothetical protein